MSRARILELLHAATTPMSASEVAKGVGLHVTTVRDHLDTLVHAGLAIKQTEEPAGRGRPRQLYHAEPLEPEQARDAGYELLATVLAEHLGDATADPSRSAEAAGRKATERLIEPTPLEGLSHEEVLRRVTDLMAELGFAPELVTDPDDEDPRAAKILLRRCPFEDLARAHTDVVCGVHLGMIRGALQQLGAGDIAAALEPFVEPQLCLVQLGPFDHAPPSSD